MSKPRSIQQRLIPSFASILMLCAIIGVSGTAAALAFSGSEATQSVPQPSGPSDAVASGRLSNGTAYEVTVTKSDDGICVVPKLDNAGGPAVLCGPAPSQQTGDIHLTYVESNGSILIVPIVSSRVQSVAVTAVDGAGETVDVVDGAAVSRAQARALSNVGVRAAAISLPLRLTSSSSSGNGAPPQVSFRLTAFDDTGRVVASETPDVDHAPGSVDETR